MSPILQGLIVVSPICIAVILLMARNRKHLPVTSLFVRLLFLIARWWWCAARAADQALFSFRDEWVHADATILNESLLRIEEPEERERPQEDSTFDSFSLPRKWPKQVETFLSRMRLTQNPLIEPPDEPRRLKRAGGRK